jgi:hypothetical protein
MKAEFTALVQQLIAEQGREALFNVAKCKAFLADYTGSEYQSERRLLLQAVEAGIPTTIARTNDLAAGKQQCVQKLQDECFFAPNVAVGVVNLLSAVLGAAAQKGVTQRQNTARQPEGIHPLPVNEKILVLLGIVVYALAYVISFFIFLELIFPWVINLSESAGYKTFFSTLPEIAEFFIVGAPALLLVLVILPGIIHILLMSLLIFIGNNTDPLKPYIAELTKKKQGSKK